MATLLKMGMLSFPLAMALSFLSCFTTCPSFDRSNPNMEWRQRLLRIERQQTTSCFLRCNSVTASCLSQTRKSTQTIDQPKITIILTHIPPFHSHVFCHWLCSISRSANMFYFLFHYKIIYEFTYHFLLYIYRKRDEDSEIGLLVNATISYLPRDGLNNQYWKLMA